MKKTLVALLICFLKVQNTAYTEENAASNIVVCDVSTLDSEKLHDIFMTSLEDVILMFPAGIKIPVKFNLTGDLFHLSMENTNPLVLEFKQRTYLKFVYEQPLLSFDLEEWKPLDQLAKVKKEINVSTFGEIPLGELNLELLTK